MRTSLFLPSLHRPHSNQQPFLLSPPLPSPSPFPPSHFQLYLYFVNVNPLVTKPGDLALSIFIDDMALLTGLDVVTTMGLPGQGNVTTIILQFSTAGYFATTIDIKESQPSRVRAPFDHRISPAKTATTMAANPRFRRKMYINCTINSRCSPANPATFNIHARDPIGRVT